MTATQLVGWTLLHFLWQGAIVATVLAILLQLTRRLAPEARYHLSLAALGLMVLCPLVTADRLSRSPHPLSPAPLGSGGTAVQEGTALQERSLEIGSSEPVDVPTPDVVLTPPQRAEPGMVATLRRRLEPWLPWLVGAWVAGVLLLSVRLLGGLVRARRLGRAGSAPRPAYAALFAQLAQRLGITVPVNLLESTALGVPAVIGWLRPVVLLPTAAAAGLTPQQLELLLAHELAHVRRHDYLVNLLQSVVETLLFYHPAVWWVSARVREEREHCCDDVALAACGHPREYAGALLALATWRLPLPVPAAVGSGALLRRVRRILGQDAGPVELGPVWVSGLLAASLALAVVVGIPARAAEVPEAPPDPQAFMALSDTGRARPDTILRHPGGEDFARRWEWALATAGTQGYAAYWVGYVVPAPGDNRQWHYLDRHIPIEATDLRLTGHVRFTGGWNDLRFDGTALAPLLGDRAPQDLAVLLGFVPEGDGARLVRVHLSNWVFPVHFGGWPLMWLGESSDGESIARLQTLYRQSKSSELRADLIGMVSAHADAGAAVPALVGWLESREPDELRAEAAEGLESYPVPEALRALDRSARTDRADEVRVESIEALGALDMTEATGALTRLLDGLKEQELRAEAVEALGDRHDEQSKAALDAVIQGDPDVEIQRAAVEALGKLLGSGGVAELLAIAREHKSAEVQRAAVEALGGLEHGAGFEALLELARTHDREEIQVSAVEALAHAGDAAAALPALTDLAAHHARPEVRRAAVEALGSLETVEAAFQELQGMIWRLPDVQSQVEAVETIGELDVAGVTPLLADVARRHPSKEVQLEAVGALADRHDHAAAIEALRRLVETHSSSELRVEAVDHLGDFEGAEVGALLREYARGNKDLEVRRQAIEELGQRESGREEVEVLVALARNDPDADLREAALEALSALPEGAGIPALIEISRSHPSREVRVRAIELLGESEDPRALDALRDLIKP